MRPRTLTHGAAVTGAAVTALLLMAPAGAAAPEPTPAPWPKYGHDGKGQKAGDGTPRLITPPPPGTIQQNRSPYAPIEETTESGQKSFTLQTDVLFKTGSADLSDASEKYLSEVVNKLKGASVTGQVKVVGHTDDVGEPPDNLSLSKRRAEAVTQKMQPLLANTGVTLAPEGKGETQPRERGATAQARQRNRRVSILYGQAPSTPAQEDTRYLNVSDTEPAPNPGLTPLQGEPASLASTQRTIRGTWTVRLDVVELSKAGPFLKIGYRVRMASQQGNSSLKYAALFDGDTIFPKAYNAKLIDKAHGEQLSSVITGQGRAIGEWLGDGDVGAPRYGWAYFPQPSQATDKFSFYVPAFGTLDNVALA